MAEVTKEPQQITKEPQQIMKEPQGKAAQPPSGMQPVQQITKEPQRVTTKNPKKVEAGKRLRAIVRGEKQRNKRNWRPAELTHIMELGLL